MQARHGVDVRHRVQPFADVIAVQNDRFQIAVAQAPVQRLQARIHGHDDVAGEDAAVRVHEAVVVDVRQAGLEDIVAQALKQRGRVGDGGVAFRGDGDAVPRRAQDADASRPNLLFAHGIHEQARLGRRGIGCAGFIGIDPIQGCCGIAHGHAQHAVRRHAGPAFAAQGPHRDAAPRGL
ncbi:hypothetical protein D3C72_1127620 [compost metagenome]